MSKYDKGIREHRKCAHQVSPSSKEYKEHIEHLTTYMKLKTVI